MRLYLYHTPGGSYHRMVLVRRDRYVKYVNGAKRMDHITAEVDVLLDPLEFRPANMKMVF